MTTKARLSARDSRSLPLAAVILAAAGTLTAAEGPPGAEAAGAQRPAPEDRFDDPDAVLKDLTAKLSKIAGRKGLPSPADLARQAETRKTCDLETLPDPGEKLAPEQIYAKARPSVVVVGATTWCSAHRDWHTSCATGFVVHADGAIVTNHHVVTAFREMSAAGVMTEDGRVFPIQAVLAADAEDDVAVLKIDAAGLTPLPLASRAPVGANIYCLSHPALECDGSQNGFFAFTPGMVCGKFRLRLGRPAQRNVLAITADYARGSSGGPVLNESGAVVGVVCETMSVCRDEDTANVQMTWKFCRPSGAILALVSRGPTPDGKR